MNRLSGKVALITGGARGQGEAEARLFAAEGARVVIGDILDDAGEAVATELGSDRAAFIHLDATNAADWDAAVAFAAKRFDGLDILVNNAGGGPIGNLLSQPTHDYDVSIALNQTGPWLGTRAVAPMMRARGGGSIINISSVFGMIGGSGAYSIGKWALRGLTKISALQLADDQIRVNSVHPGVIDTELVAPASGPDLRTLIAANKQVAGLTIPLRRIGEPAEVAHLVLFLASDESSYCTGSEFVIDGGLLAGPLATQ